MKRLAIRITDEDLELIERSRGAVSGSLEEVVETMIHTGVQFARSQMDLMTNGPGWTPAEAFRPKIRPMILPMELAPEPAAIDEPAPDPDPGSDP